MDNHYHPLIETRQQTLANGMREVNVVYTQAFNRQYRRVGHVQQGRYKAILVDQDAYLLELARYNVLNPARADLVPSAGEFSWNSYQAVMGKTPAPNWLAVDDILAMILSAGTSTPSIRAVCHRRRWCRRPTRRNTARRHAW